MMWHHHSSFLSKSDMYCFGSEAQLENGSSVHSNKDAMVIMLQSSNFMAGCFQSHAIHYNPSLLKGKMIKVHTRGIRHLCQNLCKFKEDMVPSLRLLDVRCMSNLLENTIYGGPKPQSPWERLVLE
ncbi:hypothetical protein SUGI_0669570 [Cryptomeria japonica]|nr:hypothetical protein SUGI_0669570 [Cryptomeria japonica]